LVYFQAELKPGFKLEDVEKAIYEEIEALQNISPSELDKAKRLIEADLVLSNEQPLQQAILLGQYETIAFAERIPAESRGYQFLDSLLENIRNVSAENVTRIARKYFTKDNRTVGYLVNEVEGGASDV